MSRPTRSIAGERESSKLTVPLVGPRPSTAAINAWRPIVPRRGRLQSLHERPVGLAQRRKPRRLHTFDDAPVDRDVGAVCQVRGEGAVGHVPGDAAQGHPARDAFVEWL